MTDKTMTDEQKIRALATWSRRYRSGVQEMVEAGHDPDELDRAVEEAEPEVAEAEKAEAARRARRRRLDRF